MGYKTLGETMNFMYLLLCVITFFNCGKKVKESEPQNNARVGELRGKYEENLKIAQNTWNKETGWPDVSDCDATLWAGLGKASGASFTQLELARQSDGKIHRRPNNPCFKDGVDLGAKSTISKDMLLGYVYGIWRSGNKEALDGLFEYGKSHNWIMGEPASDVGRVLLTPNGIATLCRAMRSFGGSDKTECHLPVSFASGNEDYQEHLAVLGILLWGEVSGELGLTDQIPKGGLETLTDIAYKHANDALFQAAYAQYTDGNYTRSVDLLLGDYSYPTYVRGSENYKLVHWLFAANLILRNFSHL